MKKAILIALISFAGLTLKSQPNLDSLFSVWKDTMQTDSNRATAYAYYINYGFQFSQPDSLLKHSEILISFLREKNFRRWEGLIYRGQGNALDMQGEYIKAIDMYNISLKIAEEMEDKQSMAKALGAIGTSYAHQGIYPIALEYMTRCLIYTEETGDKKGMSVGYANMGNLYNKIGDYTKALEYQTKCLAIAEEMGDKRGMAVALANQATAYLQLGDYTKVLDGYMRSLKLYEEIGDRVGIELALENIGTEYRRQGDFSSALEYFDKCLIISKEINAKDKIARVYYNYGAIYLDQGNYAKAITECERSLQLYEEIESIEGQKRACHCLYESYKAMGNGSRSLAYYEQMVFLKDSIFNEENTKKITRLEVGYEYDKKEVIRQAEQEKKDALAAQELKQQKMVRNGFIGGFAVVFLFAGVFFNQRNRIGKEKARSEALLLNILPEEVAEELRVKGAAEAVQIDQATVLFTDFKGFTTMAEKLSPKELVSDLNICFSEFDRIMEKYGIEKIKTIGDAYMAAGGLPSPNTTHAKDVIKAAFEMRDFIEAGKAQKIADGKPYFEIRIGVHTGPLVAGIVGVKKFQYDIWGDTVNTASRMESSGEVGKVNISEATYGLLKEDAGYIFESRGKIEAKGKGAMGMYFVLKT